MFWKVHRNTRGCLAAFCSCFGRFPSIPGMLRSIRSLDILNVWKVPGEGCFEISAAASCYPDILKFEGSWRRFFGIPGARFLHVFGRFFGIPGAAPEAKWRQNEVYQVYQMEFPEAKTDPKRSISSIPNGARLHCTWIFVIFLSCELVCIFSRAIFGPFLVVGKSILVVRFFFTFSSCVQQRLAKCSCL